MKKPIFIVVYTDREERCPHDSTYVLGPFMDRETAVKAAESDAAETIRCTDGFEWQGELYACPTEFVNIWEVFELTLSEPEHEGTKTKYQTLKEIKEAPIVGNAYDDWDILNSVHEFVLSDENSMEDKIDALVYMEQSVMGCKGSKVTDQDVRRYIREAK